PQRPRPAPWDRSPPWPQRRGPRHRPTAHHAPVVIGPAPYDGASLEHLLGVHHHHPTRADRHPAMGQLTGRVVPPAPCGPLLAVPSTDRAVAKGAKASRRLSGTTCA